MLMLIVCGCRQEQKPTLGKAGDALPSVTLPDLQGNKVTVPDDFKNKVIIIRFWGTWCDACAKEIPIIDHVYRKYRGRGVEVLAVNVGQPRSVAEAFVTNLKITYPVLLDTYSIAAKRYNIKVLPVTIIVDKKGIVRGRIFGEAEKESIEAMVTDIL